MQMSEVFILLVCSHVFGDFLLQNNWIVANKRRFSFLALHCLIHGVVSYLVLQHWEAWLIIPSVFLFHALIDRIKIRLLPQNATGFVVDQILHLLSLALIAEIFVHLTGVRHPYPASKEHFRDSIVILAGFVATVQGSGFLIANVAGKIIDQNPDLKTYLDKGLKYGGAQIGQLERALIFVLMMIGEAQGIGFLIAAKSILRFEEAKKEKIAEYVLIGTLWSFTLAIAISWLTKKTLGPISIEETIMKLLQ